MIPKIEGTNIVLVGNWNRMIFSPQWVAANVFKTKEIQASVLMPTLEMTFSDDLACVDVGDGRLTLRPRHISDKAFEKCEEIADTVLGMLQHTPLSAVGINYAFSQSDPSNRLADLFNFCDAAELGAADWVSEEKKIFRRLRHDDQIMYLTITSNNSGVSIDINFHHDVKGAKDARETVRGRFVANRSRASGLLKEVYDLSTEEPAR